jgi:hypothetical protein
MPDLGKLFVFEGPDGDLWPRWRDAYSALAEQEMNVDPVVIIPNEQDMSAAQERILESL